MFIRADPVHILLQRNLQRLHSTTSRRWAIIHLTDLPDGLQLSQIFSMINLA